MDFFEGDHVRLVDSQKLIDSFNLKKTFNLSLIKVNLLRFVEIKEKQET